MKDQLLQLTEQAEVITDWLDRDVKKKNTSYDDYSKNYKKEEESILKYIEKDPSGISDMFDEYRTLPYYRKIHLLVQSPKIFHAVINAFPGKLFENIGDIFLAEPDILEAAIDAGERIPPILGTRDNMVPSIHKPLLRVKNVQSYYPENYPGALDSKDPYDRYFREEMDAFERCLRLLIAYGFSISSRDRSGADLLLKATELAYYPAKTEAIRILVKLGSTPDQSVNLETGETVLHKLMYRYPKSDGVDYFGFCALLDSPYPIDLEVADHSGLSPLDLVVNCRHGSIIEPFNAILDRQRLQIVEMGCSPYNIFKTTYKQPLLYLLAEAGNHPLFEELSDMIIYFSDEFRDKELTEKGLALTCLVHEKMPHHDGKHFVTHRTKRLIDVIIENKNSKFSPRVVEYYHRKMKEFGMTPVPAPE